MAWFKVDDKLHSSRKFLSIPKRARFAATGLWAFAGSWSADQLTDGHIPGYMIEQWGPPPSAVAALVDAELWDRESDGFVFRNWHEYQPSRRDVEGEREAKRERMRQLRAKRKQTKAQEHAGNESMLPRTFEHAPETVLNSRPVPSRPDPTLVKDSPKPPNDPPKKRETRLPKTWVPTQSHHDRANHLGVNIQEQTEKFRLHAETHDRRAANWNAAFTQWLIKSGEFKQQDQQRGTYRSQNQIMRDMHIQAAARDAAANTSALALIQGGQNQ